MVNNFYDDVDSISDTEIFERIEEKWEYFEKIQDTKKRINAKNSLGENKLHEAAKHSLDEVKFLIEKCGFHKVINSQDHGGWTPLSEAVIFGQADIVQYLIEKGANVNTSATAGLINSDDSCVSFFCLGS